MQTSCKKIGTDISQVILTFSKKRKDRELVNKYHYNTEEIFLTHFSIKDGEKGEIIYKENSNKIAYEISVSTEGKENVINYNLTHLIIDGERYFWGKHYTFLANNSSTVRYSMQKLLQEITQDGTTFLLKSNRIPMADNSKEKAEIINKLQKNDPDNIDVLLLYFTPIGVLKDMLQALEVKAPEEAIKSENKVIDISLNTYKSKVDLQLQELIKRHTELTSIIKESDFIDSKEYEEYFIQIKHEELDYSAMLTEDLEMLCKIEKEAIFKLECKMVRQMQEAIDTPDFIDKFNAKVKFLEAGEKKLQTIEADSITGIKKELDKIGAEKIIEINLRIGEHVQYTEFTVNDILTHSNSWVLKQLSETLKKEANYYLIMTSNYKDKSFYLKGYELYNKYKQLGGTELIFQYEGSSKERKNVMEFLLRK